MFLSALTLASCVEGSSGTEGQSITITDMISRSIEIKPGSYKRVVCIGAGALRLYSYIGDVSLLVGVEDTDNENLSSRPKMFDGTARPYVMANRDFFKTLPSCGVGGPNAQTAEEEKILSCNPDIVISEYEDVTKADALQSKLGVPVVTTSYGSKGVFDERAMVSLQMLGQVFAKETRATSLVSFIESERDDISNRTDGVLEDNKPVTYICGLGNWGTTNQYSTAQNYEPFNVAHIRNVVTDLPTGGVQTIDEEKFVSLGSSMDVMIIDAAAVKNIKPTFSADEFSSCKAWNNGKVYLQMAYNAYYTNLEIALANTWYCAMAVYPSLFSDIDIDTKTDQITTAFLGQELANAIKGYPNSYGGYQPINTGTFFA
jgi:ABC-type Fe3+-hydroxamate transport system, periplasmic component